MDQQTAAFQRYERGLVLKQLRMFYPAIEDFRKAALDPSHAGKAHVQVALCLRAVGRHDEAVLAFRQALAAPLVSAEEQRHILYHMGQTLESVGRYAESLEVYGWIRKEDPAFRDVTQRIKHLSSGRGPAPQRRGAVPMWKKNLGTLAREFTPHMVSWLEQTGEWMRGQNLFGKSAPSQASGIRHALPARSQSQPVKRDRTQESRRHPRVPVRLRSHFSAKGRMLAGEGELRDLSPWGCRVTSAVAVPVGVDVECCIFPQGAAHPFVIDGATVRWMNAREFGLAFTHVRPNVQRQIAQLCRGEA
jgi:tetratricopeptide (TPR) repeat protein